MRVAPKIACYAGLCIALSASTSCKQEVEATDNKLSGLHASAIVNGESFKVNITNCLKEMEKSICAAALISGETYISSLDELCQKLNEQCDKRDLWRAKLDEFETQINQTIG